MKLKNLKSFSILIIPDGAHLETKSHKLTLTKIVTILLAYSIVIAVLGYVVLSVTDAGTIIFPGKSKLTKSDMAQVNLLNKKLLFLTRELESLKSTNSQLKYAIMLGDSTLLDSLSQSADSTQKSKANISGGNLFEVVKKLYNEVVTRPKSAKNLYFTSPVNGFISRGFNPENGHFGIDYVVKSGTPVYASASGYVVFSGYTVKDGYMLIINHPENYVTVFKHCSVLMKKSREEVNQGEVIALSGNSGEITTGPHLHFEIWKDGKPINPNSVLINQ